MEAGFDRLLALRADEALLDLGCGDGSYLADLRRRGFGGRLTGVDLAPELIAAARSRGDLVEYVVGDALALPFPEGSFDAVSARYVLDHFADPAVALDEICRVLRPGGRLLRIANAHGHLAQFWRAVASASRGFPGLEPLAVTSPGDPRLEQRLAALAAERFEEVEVTYLERTVSADAADLLALLESHRANFAALTQDQWEAAGAALTGELGGTLDAAPAAAIAAASAADLATPDGRPPPRPNLPPGLRLDLRLAVVRASYPRR